MENKSLKIACFCLISSISIATPQLAHAQSITAATDANGTGTIITIDGNTYHINGGTQAGANLFHSFQQFGLNPSEIAHFLSQPQIRNVVGRVVGGNPSMIEGLIRLTGGNSNLFLLNEAGWIFTQGASLDVPASFGVSTANQMAFEDGIFNTSGTNEYSLLTGDPLQLIFNTDQPGSILNAGNLAVPTGESLYLIGGSVISTGTLSAPGGNVTISAVPGTSQVELSHDGLQVKLVLDALPLTAENNPGQQGMTAVDLVRSLTGMGDVAGKVGLETTADGRVLLVNSGQTVPNDVGTAIVTGEIDAVSDTGVGGNIDVFGDKVGLFDATLNVSGETGGGNVRVGGDYQGKGTVPNASRTYVSQDSEILADAGETGDGGRVIVWADETTRFVGRASVRGGEAWGNGGFVEISGKETLDYRGIVDTIAPNGNNGSLLLDPRNLEIISGGGSFTALTQIDAFSDSPNTDGTIDVALIIAALNAGTDVTIQATGNITVSGAIDDSANLNFPALRLEAWNDIIINADIDRANNSVTYIIADTDNIIDNTGGIVGLDESPFSYTTGSANNGSGGSVTINNAKVGNFAMDTGSEVHILGRGHNGEGEAGVTLNNAQVRGAFKLFIIGEGGDGADGTNGANGQDGGAGILLQGTNTLSSDFTLGLSGTGGDGGDGSVGGAGGLGISAAIQNPGIPNFSAISLNGQPGISTGETVPGTGTETTGLTASTNLNTTRILTSMQMGDSLRPLPPGLPAYRDSYPEWMRERDRQLAIAEMHDRDIKRQRQLAAAAAPAHARRILEQNIERSRERIRRLELDWASEQEKIKNQRSSAYAETRKIESTYNALGEMEFDNAFFASRAKSKSELEEELDSIRQLHALYDRGFGDNSMLNEIEANENELKSKIEQELHRLESEPENELKSQLETMRYELELYEGERKIETEIYEGDRKIEDQLRGIQEHRQLYEDRQRQAIENASLERERAIEYVQVILEPLERQVAERRADLSEVERQHNDLEQEIQPELYELKRQWSDLESQISLVEWGRSNRINELSTKDHREFDRAIDRLRSLQSPINRQMDRLQNRVDRSQDRVNGAGNELGQANNALRKKSEDESARLELQLLHSNARREVERIERERTYEADRLKAEDRQAELDRRQESLQSELEDVRYQLKRLEVDRERIELERRARIERIERERIELERERERKRTRARAQALSRREKELNGWYMLQLTFERTLVRDLQAAIRRTEANDVDIPSPDDIRGRLESAILLESEFLSDRERREVEYEQERREREREQSERLEAEREQIERERQERLERMRQERLERDRRDSERREAEDRETERREQERIERERREAEDRERRERLNRELREGQ